MLLVFRAEQGQAFTLASNSSCSTASVDVYLRIERALVMEDILDIGDIETSSSDVRAYKHSTVLRSAVLTSLHLALEPV